MNLTGPFEEVVYERLERDSAFRQALLAEARTCFRSGDRMTGKALLGDLVQGTIGFERLPADLGRPARSLRLMLSPRATTRAPRTCWPSSGRSRRRLLGGSAGLAVADHLLPANELLCQLWIARSMSGANASGT
jgi:hypothetical protein